MISERVSPDEIRATVGALGVPTNPVMTARSAAEVEAIARQLDSPVAIKAISDQIVHKSKAGAIRLDVAPEEAAAEAQVLADHLMRHGDVVIDGFTVERMVPAGTEVVVGGVWHPSFGPLAMFGSGGVDVEILGDTRFRTAPLTLPEAKEMILDSRVGRIIGQRMPHQVATLAEVICAIAGADGILTTGEVTEIDINPLVVTETDVIAVDARASRGSGSRPAISWPDPLETFEALKPAIYPRSIAVIGASADQSKLGYRAVQTLLDFGFAGPIYPVNPRGGAISGLNVVDRTSALPPEVDRAVVVLPAAAVEPTLDELDERGVRSAHVYTADVPQFTERRPDSAIRVLGPNCIGHYTPYERVTMIGERSSSPECGSIAFVSQSGTYAGDAVRRGCELGMRFSFVSSVGSCYDVSPTELLAFCEADERTSAVAFYLETDEGAAEFFRLASAITMPVILLKGGRSKSGISAAASHTGAMAADPSVLVDVAAASGVLLVDDFESAMDVLLALQVLPPIAGDGLALFGSGGGEAVVGADLADAAGLTIPRLGDEARNRLRQYEAPGTSCENPIDIPIWSLFGPTGTYTGSILNALVADDQLDAVCAYLDLGTVFDVLPEDKAKAMIVELVGDLIAEASGSKPTALVLRSDLAIGTYDLIHDLRRQAAAQRVPMFDSVRRAVDALGRVRQLTRMGRTW